ncbi:hypothetical protein HZP42_10235 [Elizabethkingia anophelis]|uniref:hypothetical protein n=2 Tax=Weeksellaceae TaxID=2762318 RepID=UPI0022271DC8|nr:hypothetical protein [Elizabethkingia anophelis]MCT4236763.1 hypothetical protein [Elizabethkingia anophelis]MCW2463363.1 hypothetical protein [Elizabethkingia anophelis]MCW2470804.1 hypothetical protein [Elizabethkingia anophelis]HBI9698727.1 hypothetical protein [Elizabethkingia anophelis]
MEVLKLQKESMFQRIKSSYIDEGSVELTPKEQSKKERLEKIWALRINNKYSSHQVIQIAVRDFKNDKGDPISRATAYRDYAWSMAIFGDVDQANKAAEKMVVADAYWTLYQKGVKTGNDDLALRSLNSYERIMGFDKTESLADLLKYKSVDVTIKLSRKQSKALNNFYQLGVTDFNDFDAEDVDYTEVGENEEIEDDE